MSGRRHHNETTDCRRVPHPSARRRIDRAGVPPSFPHLYTPALLRISVAIAGYMMLLAFCLIAWSVVITWALVPWRETAGGILICVGMALAGFVCVSGWLDG